MNDVAALLNSGVLRSASNNSLADLGMYASGSGGNLTFSTGSGNFVSTGSGVPTISAGIGGVSAVVSNAVAASDFQVFTREGRHIAGTALTEEDITNLLTAKNGFSSEAVYRAEYLNDEDNAYRGMGLNVSHVGGLYRVETGSNGSLPARPVAPLLFPQTTRLRIICRCQWATERRRQLQLLLGLRQNRWR